MGGWQSGLDTDFLPVNPTVVYQCPQVELSVTTKRIIGGIKNFPTGGSKSGGSHLSGPPMRLGWILGGLRLAANPGWFFFVFFFQPGRIDHKNTKLYKLPKSFKGAIPFIFIIRIWV